MCKSESKHWKGYLKTVQQCRLACEADSHLLFSYGTRDHGSMVCHGEGCPCYCEWSSQKRVGCLNGETNHRGYDIFHAPGNEFFHSSQCINIVVFTLSYFSFTNTKMRILPYLVFVLNNCLIDN